MLVMRYGDMPREVADRRPGDSSPAIRVVPPRRDEEDEMARAMTTAATAAGVAGGLVALRGILRRAPGARGTAGPRAGWLGVTVQRTADELVPGGELPPPLEAFGD